MAPGGDGSWQTRRLGDFAAEVRVPFEPSENEDLPYVGLEHIEQDTLALRGYGDSADVTSTKRRFVSGDVLFGSLRPYFRKVVRPRVDGVCSTDITVVRPVDGAGDASFLKYFLANRKFIGHASNVATGTRMPRANWKTLSRSSWRVPALFGQRKIAAILSAYDDLIENSLRRIEILEEMARNLYREWFVEFRFPGHERVRFVGSPLGPIPEGWRAVPLFDVSCVTYGFPFSAKLFETNGRGRPVVRIRDVLKGESVTYSEEVPADKYIVRNGDVLVGMDGAFHMGFWVGGDAWLVQRVARFRPRIPEMSRLHLFHAIQGPIRRLNDTIVGTTVSHLGNKHLKAVKVVLPPREVLSMAKEHFDPLLNELILLRMRGRVLRQARDLLLPKLISGELDVSDLPVRMPPLYTGDRHRITKYRFFREITDLPFVTKVVLFGSRARGDHEERSDIDLCVFCQEGTTEEEWMQVLACLERDRVDTLLKVDCVRFETGNAALRENVLTEGIVLYEGSESP